MIRTIQSSPMGGLALIAQVMLHTAVIGTLALLAGCQSEQSSAPQYTTIKGEPLRDTDRARTLNERAVFLIEEENWGEAEETVTAAIEADVMFGPAHNNLGLIRFHQKRYYEAAWEFKYAAKLSPHSPEPRNNLGLVFEAVSQYSDAKEQFAEASRLGQDNPEYLGNLARTKVRLAERDEDLHQILKRLALIETRPQWQQWVQLQLQKSPASKSP